MKIFNKFEIDIAPPKTAWWTKAKAGDLPGYVRKDTIIGIDRTYVRHYRAYIYSICIGRLKIRWIK